ncbi:hypothetical protein ABIB57_000072 [Devosia sp. UYZn731]
MMTPGEKTPAAASTAGREYEVYFGKLIDPTATSPRFQLVGSSSEHIVALQLGVVVAWASLIGAATHVHLVAPLRLSDSCLATFREVVGSDPDAIVCLWEAL